MLGLLLLSFELLLLLLVSLQILLLSFSTAGILTINLLLFYLGCEIMFVRDLSIQECKS